MRFQLMAILKHNVRIYNEFELEGVVLLRQISITSNIHNKKQLLEH